MSTYTDNVLGIQVDNLNRRLLSNREFLNLRADELVLGPISSWDEDFVVQDCRFANCKIDPGALIVYEGLQLRNVVFEDMRANDAFTISSHVLLDHVTIKGNSRSAGLWIKPLEPDTPETMDKRLLKRLSKMASGVEVMLDISEFVGPDVEILGLPESKVIINKERHVIVRSAGKVNWEKLRIPRHSLWRIAFAQVRNFGVDVGVYNIPSPDENEQAFLEFKLLRKEGLL